MLATFEIRKSRSKPFGRIEVRAPEGDSRVCGLFYYIGDRPKGYVPIRGGAVLAIAWASRLSKQFAKQHDARYVVRDGGKVRTTS